MVLTKTELLLAGRSEETELPLTPLLWWLRREQLYEKGDFSSRDLQIFLMLNEGHSAQPVI